jgi:hypothetical protein
LAREAREISAEGIAASAAGGHPTIVSAERDSVNGKKGEEEEKNRIIG